MKLMVAAIALGLLVSACLAQVDTLWFRHHQYSPSYPHQFMRPTKTMHVDAAGNTYVAAYGQFNSLAYVLIVLKYNIDGELVWESVCNAGGTEIANAIAVDNAGAVYVTGQSITTSSDARMLIAKWHPDGRLAWFTRLRGTPTSYHNVGHAIAVTGDELYVAGMLTNSGSRQDMTLVKLRAGTGAELWRRGLSRNGNDGYHEAAYDVCITPSNDIFVGGRTYFVGDGYDATILRYTSAGDLVWQQHVNTGTRDEGFFRICLAGDVVAGTGYCSQDAITAAYRTGGQFQWRRLYAGPGGGADVGNDIAADHDGNFVVCGTASVTGGSSALVTKYRATDGSSAWEYLYSSGSGADEGMALSIDELGNTAVGCRNFEAESPLTVLKVNSTGSRSWVFRLKSPVPGGANGALNVACREHEVIASGMVNLAYPNYNDPMVMKLREVPDVGLVEIIEPSGPYATGDKVCPKVKVRNYSLLSVSFGCRFEVSDGYDVERPVDLAPGQEAEIEFPEWEAGVRGWWRCRGHIRSAWDYDRTNDTLDRLVYVVGPAVDVGVQRIVQPNRNLPYETSVVPTAAVRNFGIGPADVWVFFNIDAPGNRVYRDSTLLAGLAPNGLDTTVRFRPWVAKPFGLLAARCSTWTAGDGFANNDTAVYRFYVINQPVGSWTRLPDVPASSSRNTVGNGGGLASDADRLYVLKGNKTRELHIFDVANESWYATETVPAGADGRQVDKGGAVIADEFGRVYVVKGGRSFEFWRYDPVAGWAALAEIPAGPKLKSPKGGTGMASVVWHDTGYIYLLKGAGRDEFYRYNVVRDTWDSMPAAPAGTSGKAKYGNGSALAYDGEGKLFCLKGKHNEVFAFAVKTGNWLNGQLPNVPMVGFELRSRKVNHGGDICWADGKPAVLKGGNTCEFWRLEPADSAWHEYPPVPYAIEKSKRVKAGGGVEFAGASYYVLKGNKTLEFWRFDVAVRDEVSVGPGMRDGVASSYRMRALDRVSVSPNPLRGIGRVDYAAPLTEPVTLTLHDAAGRAVWQTMAVAGRSTALIDARRIPAGVYFLVVAGGRGRLEQKVIIAR